MKKYTFMTFNALTDSFFLPGNPSFSIRKKAIHKMVETYHPDLIGTQEINHHMMSEISDAFPGYTSFGDSRHARYADEYNLIFYRNDRFELYDGRTLWLSPHPERKGSRFPGSQFPRIVTIACMHDMQNNLDFTFVNTHLDANFSVVRYQQTEVLLKLLNQYRKGDFTVLTGDFNATIGNKEISLIQTEMKDLTKSTIGSTLRGKLGSIRNHNLPIDHIFITPSFSDVQLVKITDSCNGVYPSDHYPLLATVRFEG